MQTSHLDYSEKNLRIFHIFVFFLDNVLPKLNGQSKLFGRESWVLI